MDLLAEIQRIKSSALQMSAQIEAQCGAGSPEAIRAAELIAAATRLEWMIDGCVSRQAFSGIRVPPAVQRPAR